jgi:hypothetical protein
MSTTAVRRACLLAAAFTLVSGVAWAANPHFAGNVRNLGISSNGSDTVTGKVAGLGSETNVKVKAAADVAALFACKLNGGGFTSDPKTQTITGKKTVGQTFKQQNGQATFALTLLVSSGLTCPSGQQPVLACIEYENKRASFATQSGQFSQPEATVPSSAQKIFFSRFTNECKDLFANNPG